MKTTRNFPAALARARMLARSNQMPVYIVPTAYGYTYHYTAATVAHYPVWIEVMPDDTATEVMPRWTNDGKTYVRTVIA